MRRREEDFEAEHEREPRRHRHRDWEDDAEPLLRRRSGGSLLWLWLGLGGAVILAGVAVIAVLVLNRSSAAGPTASRFSKIPGLVAHWSFDEVQGDKVLDQSGRNNHATLRGARIDKGVVGQALWLDGNKDQYCEIGSSSDFDFPANGPFTFAGWFTTNDAAGMILSLRHERKNTQIDLIIREGRLLVVVGDDNDPGPLNAFVWAQQPNDGQWHHFAFTRTGPTIELFLDGVSQGRNAAIKSDGPITTNLRAMGSNRLWILNNDQRFGTPSYRGGIDELCVFTRVLTMAEIQSLMAK